MRPITTAGQANQVLVALYGNAGRAYRLAVTDDGDVYRVPAGEDDARLTTRGLVVRGNRNADQARSR